MLGVVCSYAPGRPVQERGNSVQSEAEVHQGLFLRSGDGLVLRVVVGRTVHLPDDHRTERGRTTRAGLHLVRLSAAILLVHLRELAVRILAARLAGRWPGALLFLGLISVEGE